MRPLGLSALLLFGTGPARAWDPTLETMERIARSRTSDAFPSEDHNRDAARILLEMRTAVEGASRRAPTPAPGPCGTSRTGPAI